MATIDVRQRPTGTMLEFRTETGQSWTVSVETLSRMFGRQARETLQQWARERQEEERDFNVVARSADQDRSFTALDTRPEGQDEIIWHALENAEHPDLTRDLSVTIRLRLDGDQWSALLGENLTVGVGGFGDSVNEAVRDLSTNVEAEHRNWLEFQERP